jgi:hypothetical protein
MADNTTISIDPIAFVEMKRPHNLIAYFIEDIPAVDSFDLVLIPAPAAGGSAVTSGRYAQNSTVQIVATANTGYKFVS